MSSDLRAKSRTHGYKTLDKADTFWSKCGESHTKGGDRTRLDPVLKLYPGCPVMFTSNMDVEGGIGNGSQGEVQQVVLKFNHSPITVQFHSHQVKAVYASDIEFVNVNLSSTEHLGTRKINTKEFTFKCNYPLPQEMQFGTREARHLLEMKGRQLPFVSNTATTGHKLQGATKDTLYIPYWHYGTPNWPYVVISRVRTRYGLFLGEKLNPDKDYSMDSRIVRMLNYFQQFTPDPFDLEVV